MSTKREAYMSMVGGFLWLSNMTMFTISYAAGQLARFLTNPGPTSKSRIHTRSLAAIMPPKNSASALLSDTERCILENQ